MDGNMVGRTVSWRCKRNEVSCPNCGSNREIANGKLTLEEAGAVLAKAKSRYKRASIDFDGVSHLGPQNEVLIARTTEDSQGKLSLNEVAGILYYMMFDKIDTSLETPLMIKTFLESGYGSDRVGCNSDMIPEGIGEFGFDVTNPIPVRGMSSNPIYLRWLRTTNGKKVEFKRLGSGEAANIAGKIDEYRIISGGEDLSTLYIHPYNKRISRRPPEGFILIQRDD